jgi:hypothetical protein
VIDLNTGYLDRQFIFEQRPSAMAITPNGKRLYVTFTKGHTDSTGGNPQVGYVAEFDLERMLLTREMELPIDPADIVATDSGLLIISSGSDQSTEIAVFKASTGEKIGRRSGLYRGMQLALHPSQQIVYGADYGLSPADIYHFTISETMGVPDWGAIIEMWDSQYHGEYHFGQDIFALPDGSGVLSAVRGVLLTSSTNRQNDLVYKTTLPIDTIHQVAFDTDRKLMAAVHGAALGALSIFDYTSNFPILTKSIENAYYVGFHGRRAAVISLTSQGSGITFHSIPATTPEDNLPPTISVLNPESTETFVTAGSFQTFYIEAADEDGTIQQIKLYQGTNEVASSTNRALAADLLIGPGTNSFQAVAYDNLNGSATSAVFTVYGNIPPTVSFIYPLPESSSPPCKRSFFASRLATRTDSSTPCSST